MMVTRTFLFLLFPLALSSSVRTITAASSSHDGGRNDNSSPPYNSRRLPRRRSVYGQQHAGADPSSPSNLSEETSEAQLFTTSGDDEGGECDESFPLAPPAPSSLLPLHGNLRGRGREEISRRDGRSSRRLVAIPPRHVTVVVDPSPSSSAAGTSSSSVGDEQEVVVGSINDKYGHINGNNNENDRGAGNYYESGEYYAPLCPDLVHIDIRKLQRCEEGSCWNECIGVRIHETPISFCFLPFSIFSLSNNISFSSKKTA